MASADDTTTGQGQEAVGDGVVDATNEELLAELEREQGGAAEPDAPSTAKPVKPAKAAKAPTEPADEDDDEDAPADDEADDEDEPSEDEDADGAKDDEDDEPADEDDDEDELAAAAAKDPELAKRMSAVRRTEQRQRQRLERERQEFDRERQTFQTEKQQHGAGVERFTRAAARAKYDPAGALESLGLSPDDMEYAAQQCYARSKSAAAAPDKKYRDAADRAMRDREHADELRQTRAELDEVKKGLEKREQEAAVARELDAFFDRTFKRAGDDAPITRNLIKASPKRARAALTATAAALAQKLGRMPKSRELLAAHERKEARELKLRGVSAPAAAPAAKPGTAADASGKKPGAKPAPAAQKPADEAPRPTNGVVHHPSNQELLAELRAAASGAS